MVAISSVQKVSLVASDKIISFAECEEIRDDDSTYSFLKTNRFIPAATIYLGFGYQGIIMLDNGNGYDCLILGGTDHIESSLNYISFMLYLDYPNKLAMGQYDDLCDDSELTFYFAKLTPPIKAVYDEIVAAHPDLEDTKILEMLKEAIK